MGSLGLGPTCRCLRRSLGSRPVRGSEPGTLFRGASLPEHDALARSECCATSSGDAHHRRVICASSSGFSRVIVGRAMGGPRKSSRETFPRAHRGCRCPGPETLRKAANSGWNGRAGLSGASMSDLVGLLNLLAPFFGLIGLGFVCAKLVRRPEGGLAWMQFFLIYVSLPCLFYKLIADKPLEQLANWPLVVATT